MPRRILLDVLRSRAAAFCLLLPACTPRGEGAQGGEDSKTQPAEPSSADNDSTGEEELEGGSVHEPDLALPPADLRCGWTPLPLSELRDLVGAGDFNADGHIDLLQASTGHPEVTVFGGFDPDQGFTTSELSLISSNWEELRIADVDGDMADDLVLRSGEIRVADLWTHFNDGRGRFSAGRTVEDEVTESYMLLLVGDYNGDGLADLTYAGGYVPISIAYGDGTGRFRDTEKLDFSGCYVTAGSWANFDGDKRPDLALVAGCNDGIDPTPVGLQLTRDEGYESRMDAGLAGGELSWIVAGDFDGDGSQDVVVDGRYEGRLGIAMLAGDGQGAFVSLKSVPAPLEGASIVSLQRARGQQGDRLVLSTNEALTVIDAPGSPNQSSCELETEAQSVLSADFNRDGRDDVLARRDVDGESRFTLWLTAP